MVSPILRKKFLNCQVSLFQSDKFITYDAYWNFPTFSGIASNYFPNLPRDIIGMAYQDGSSFLIYTASNKIMVMRKILL